MKSLKQNQCNAHSLKKYKVFIKTTNSCGEAPLAVFWQNLAWVVFPFVKLFYYLAQVTCKNVTAIINFIYINFKFQQKVASQQVSVKFAGGGDCE